ncbi:MAG TPA: isoprenylcysteine carboxylmethyltransferase family protein [Bryobacteraceae bacterium]|nr:isoprenylcysteine carboxylmethyltransferase family protein [Bryobacteraceae bacterium]
MTFSWGAILPAALLVSCLASFSWSVRHFFTRPAGFTASMKLITISATAFGLLHLFAILWSSKVSLGRSLAGSLVYLLAAGLFWWAIRTSLQRPLSAAFSPDAPEHLVQSGPYRWIRHPFYTSYLLTWIAGWIVAAYWWLLPTVVFMAAVYLVASSTEEQKFLHSPLSGAYQQYRRRTGRFFPNLAKLLATP